MSSETSVFGHDCRGIAGNGKENVERKSSLRTGRKKLALRTGEVESAERLVNKHRPAGRSDDPGNGYSASVSGELVAALAGNHAVDRTTTIELRPALSEAQQRCVSGCEADHTGVSIPGECLDGFTACG